MNKEEFKDIPWYEWFYKVSNLWNIKSLNYKRTWKENILKPWYTLSWYLTIYLFKEWKWKTFYVHRLVMLSFIWPSELQCNHKSGIRNDNRLENLEYCTSSENNLHSFRELWRKSNFQTNNPNKWKFGKNHFNSKEVNQYTLDGELIKKYDSVATAWRELQINSNRSSIAKCCNWRLKTAWGFIWKYT